MTSPSSELVPPSGESPSREPFFGWWIVGATLVLQLLVIGPGLFAFGVLLDPIAQSLNVGRGPAAIVGSMVLVVGGLLAPLAGALTGKIPIRRLMYAGVLMLALGFALVTTSQSIWMIYLGWGVFVATATVVVGPLQCAALVCNWFVRLRGRALGISQLGMVAAGAIIPLAVSWLLLNYGWRTATGVLATVPALLLVPLIWYFGVEHPEDRGQHPDGDPQSAPSETDGGEEASFGQALRDRRFWLLAASLVGGWLAFTAVAIIFISHATDSGLSAGQAALAFAILNASGAVGTFLFGTLSDYAPMRVLIALALVLISVGVLGMGGAESKTVLVLAGVVFGLGGGALMPLQTVSLGALFGAPAVAGMIGLISLLFLPFNMLGAPVSGYIYDTSGSYEQAFWLILGVCAFSMVSLMFLRLPEHRV